MENLPSDSRQPPDGHEFPDYVEAKTEEKFDLYSQQLEEKAKPPALTKTFTSIESVNSSQTRSSLSDQPSAPIQNKSFNRNNSVSNSDLSSINAEEEVTLRRGSSSLHTRSQSLIDMSTIVSQKSDRWSLLAEQRRKSYSKLKGLIIPEHVSESDTVSAVNIPEIISHTTPSFVLEAKIHTKTSPSTQSHSNATEPLALPLTTPPWTSNSSSTIPKYSPAFKRKSLQVYTQVKHHKQDAPPAIPIPNPYSATFPSAPKRAADHEELRILDNLSDAPKSLESITSPTRSDCSFEYSTNWFRKGKHNNRQEANLARSYISKLHKDLGRSEDESDNDSAVSSSQSSYISRCSPPPSPTRSCEMHDYDGNRSKSDSLHDHCRLLKPASLEAINRKNILASAKCRSGKDLKVGSPVIQRKYDDDDSAINTSSLESDNSTANLPASANKQENVTTNGHIGDEKTSSTEPPPPPPPLAANNGVADRKHAAPKAANTGRTNFVTLKPVNSANLTSTKKTDAARPSSLLRNAKALSVTDLRKSFEKFNTSPAPLPAAVAVVPKPGKPKKTEDRKAAERKPSGEVAVKVPSVKQAKTKQQVEKSAEQKDAAIVVGNNNRRKIVLCPEFAGGSIGITLAGGTDYETKEITVHKIRYKSVAYKDGQLKRGDRVISINGKDSAGLTHAESVEMLKEPVAEFLLIVEDGKEEPVSSPQRKSFIYEPTETKSNLVALPANSVTHVIKVAKDAAGLGFSIEGGKDSLQGDLPLRIKKIFLGGTDKCGDLSVGDELLAINDTSLTNLSRMEAWSLMKKLPEGNVSIHIHR